MCISSVSLSISHYTFSDSLLLIHTNALSSVNTCLIHSFPFLLQISLFYASTWSNAYQLLYYYYIVPAAIRVDRFFRENVSFTTSKCPRPNAHMHVHKCTFGKSIKQQEALTSCKVEAQQPRRHWPLLWKENRGQQRLLDVPFFVLLNISTQILARSLFSRMSLLMCCCLWALLLLRP